MYVTVGCSSLQAHFHCTSTFFYLTWIKFAVSVPIDSAFESPCVSLHSSSLSLIISLLSHRSLSSRFICGYLEFLKPQHRSLRDFRADFLFSTWKIFFSLHTQSSGSCLSKQRLFFSCCGYVISLGSFGECLVKHPVETQACYISSLALVHALTSS